MPAHNGAAARPQASAGGQGGRKLGARIKFVAGTYKGRCGWLDPDKAETERMTYVFVEKDKKSRRVLTTSFVNVEIFDSKTASGAIMKQYPEVWSSMNELCKLMAMCHVQNEHAIEFAKVFVETLQDTVEEHRADSKSTYFAKPEVKTDSKKRK